MAKIDWERNNKNKVAHERGYDIAPPKEVKFNIEDQLLLQRASRKKPNNAFVKKLWLSFEQFKNLSSKQRMVLKRIVGGK